MHLAVVATVKFQFGNHAKVWCMLKGDEKKMREIKKKAMNSLRVLTINRARHRQGPALHGIRCMEFKTDGWSRHSRRNFTKKELEGTKGATARPCT